MDQLWIKGGQALSGSVSISGSKNAILPILAACLLTDTPVTLTNLPHLQDVASMLNLLKLLGFDHCLGPNNDMQIANSKRGDHTDVPYELTAETRSSILLLGPLLARRGKAVLGLPGGCQIGTRPIDKHLEGLEQLGASICIQGNYIYAYCKELKGAHINLDIISVTTTQNLMMAATLARGWTTIQNAAQEPEVSHLAEFLTSLGAIIEGAGTSTIRICGVQQLRQQGVHHVLPDRLEAATLLIAAAGSYGHITLKGISSTTLETVIKKLRTSGALIECNEDEITLKMPQTTIHPIDIQTAPYPGFPTDLQAQIMALNTITCGVSQVTETIFENRFLHVESLRLMGAQIKTIGRTAICTGVSHLTGTHVTAKDLRGCASLIIAALMAKGETIITNANYIERGYEFLEEKLLKLNANFQWIS